MHAPSPLFSYESHVDPRPLHVPTLVVTLGSFMDAGHVQRLLDDQLLNSLDSHLLGRFDVDKLVDYRGTRPPVTFSHDHFTDYEAPRIELHQVTDAQGQEFLLLNGPEPDFRWEELAGQVDRIVEELDVRTTVLVQSIPTPTPHTRPVLVSRYASDPKLLHGNRPIFGTMRMSAGFPQMLAVRLGEAGRDVIGLGAHIPQYLAPGDYPAGVLAIMEEINGTTGLQLPTDKLQVVQTVAQTQIDQQVSQSEEIAGMVAEMERSYDEFMAEHRSLPSPDSADLPSADEIAAEAERFLAGLAEGDSDPGHPEEGDRS